MPFHVKQGIWAHYIVLQRRTQNFQEVESTFRIAGGERREEFVADHRRVAVFASVLGGGVVGVKVFGDLACGFEESFFFSGEGFVAVVQNAVHLPCLSVRIA